MPYIKKVSVPAEWTSLESLLDTIFASGTTYSIQVHEGSAVRLCNSTSLPTDNAAGECIKNLTQALYSPDAGTLYVKRDNTLPAFVSVSELGE